jgi:hypothetical protein
MDNHGWDKILAGDCIRLHLAKHSPLMYLVGHSVPGKSATQRILLV